MTGEDLSHVAPPEWIVVRWYRNKTVDQQLLNWIWQGEYEQIQLQVPDNPFEFREEPRTHMFTTGWHDMNTFIFRRIDPPKVTQR